MSCQVSEPSNEADGPLKRRTVGEISAPTPADRGLSQEAFALVLGVHRTYMGGLERGERNLTPRSLERLAARLEMDPVALLSAGDARTR